MRPGDHDYRAAQRADLLRFAAGAVDPLGFGWLCEDGRLDSDRPVQLWITCRMTHVFALGALADEAPAPGGPAGADLRALAAHGVRALRGPLADHEHGGWWSAVEPGPGRSGARPTDATKAAYAHAFVVLAAASAAQAEIPGGEALLTDALAVTETRLWDDAAGLPIEEWDAEWRTASDYRGLNAAMHTVEAFLAAGDVTGDPRWHQRAARSCRWVAELAAAHEWRIPEHFDAQWRPLLDFNRDRPADPFRPFGATVGHGLEWARLMLCTELSLAGGQGPGELTRAARGLYDRAVADGWSDPGDDADATSGFVYTTDWDGRAVVRQRMHWVLAEALNAAEALGQATGEDRYRRDAERWWDYADRCLIDHDHGSWHHELDPANRPAATVWAGKPDVYHAYQAALLPDLPLVPSFAGALAERARPPVV